MKSNGSRYPGEREDSDERNQDRVSSTCPPHLGRSSDGWRSLVRIAAPAMTSVEAEKIAPVMGSVRLTTFATATVSAVASATAEAGHYVQKKRGGPEGPPLPVVTVVPSWLRNAFVRFVLIRYPPPARACR